MTTNTTTHPVNLTSPDVLRAKAEKWLAENGEPVIHLVQGAIQFSDHHGDVFAENAFRRTLIEVTLEQRATKLTTTR